MNGLFRREVLEAKRGNWLGSISLAQPIRLWVLAALAATSAAVVLGFFTFGEYTRRSRVEGELIPDLGLSTVVAPSAGVVATLHAEEGDHVQQQAALLLINVPRVTAAGDDALKVMRDGQETRAVSLGTLQDAQDRQLQVQQRGIEQQRDALRSELKQIEGEIHTRGEQVRIGQETVQRFRQVVDQRYVSLIQLGQQEQSMLDMLNAQQSLQRQATSMRRTLAQLDQSLAELPEQRRAARATSERDLATLNQESVQAEASGELLLRAPVSGLVASRLVEAGQAVQVGQPILSLLPEGSQLRAQLLVPSAAIGFVKPGDRVLLRYLAYPYQKFGSHEGTVIRVSRSAIAAASSKGEGGEPVYRVLVSLDKQSVLAYGTPEALRPGMRLEADIMGERRRLYEWVLEPLYSVVGKVGG
ncbi:MULTISPECIES: HlyD family secretion protein [Stenotrophomonas]|uniref:HlyD family secretion protein n=1 Tax=Stenotrophomonas TaxID=40323 RepID=UPI00066D4751|nr:MULTISPECIES: HlyD family efflux transporter periplasmic adaptor subunit [Stenotrophomonas]MBA0352800.1 HlyD family efflux transporter periplasmic adaptor subunit [Stenotrophomonas maltophilia]MBH1692917.1 HlyD family efflux transporter periplasmic adaptor subunit [Stenotrophomonas maltophilia]MBH1816991.1 HlyD family efflux transporter periplasmic adaptor subunit [Stenotrophomonas maltophilia]MBN5158348.1 HlyD family efflux transporter periplasmic adaptor subunit [Stenotrophomonas maltophil